MSPVQTAPLNVGSRLAELEQASARVKRRLAALGWTDVELDKLAAGVDFRDILSGDARGMWLRGDV